MAESKTSAPDFLPPEDHRRLREAADRIRALPAWAGEIPRRREVSREFRAMIEKTGLLRGQDLDRKALAEMIKLETKIQNLVPMTLPQLLGTYHYHQFFKGFEGTEKQFAASMAETRPDWEPGDVGYPGVDLKAFSHNLRTLFAATGRDFARALMSALHLTGVGRAFLSGALNLWAPDRFPIVNGAALAPFGPDGSFPVSRPQQTRLREEGPDRLGLPAAGLSGGVLKMVSWMALLAEVRQATGLSDFLETDFFLWSLQRDDAEKTGPTEGRLLPHEALEKFAQEMTPERIEGRRSAETHARSIIERQLGHLTEDDLREVLTSLNTHKDSGSERRNRFQPAFMGANANTVVENMEAANRWIERLWNASPESLDELLDQYWSSEGAPGGRSFPTGILYLRDPEEHLVWTLGLQQGLERIAGPMSRRRQNAAAYKAYRQAAAELRKLLHLAPQAVDYVLYRAASTAEEEPEPKTGSKSASPPPPPATYTRNAFLQETSLDEHTLDELELLLTNKPQLILAGPPGTGKTYVAERLALYMAGHADRVETVQFHPSYCYEDFVEGLRPASVDGQLSYAVQPGVFRRFCERALASGERHVLLIDEINRGNLPRIFGELLSRLELRGRPIRLPTSGQELTIPPNLLVIGTMNTADHSIALVDFALRRRFHFYSLTPDPGLLRQWLKVHRPEMVWVAKLLADLNTDLRELGVDPNLLIGHSHFMNPGLDLEWLRRVWEHSVLPTIEEYFFAQRANLGKLGNLDSRVDRARQESAGTAGEDDEDADA
jgi:DNA polymerase III delta prime subunit